MKKTILCIVSAVCMTFISCGGLQTISFDQLEAADVSFPNAIRNVAIVNNMPVLEVANGAKEIGLELEGDGKIASEALAREVADANYFDQVIICDSALRSDEITVRQEDVLTKGEVQRLTTDLGVDMILSFDRVYIKTKPGLLVFPDYPLPVNAVDAIVTPVIRLYIPTKEGALFVISKQDTISWPIDETLSEQKIVAEASDYAAAMPIKHLLPHWKEQNRMYYDGGNVEMRDAGVCLRENNWDEAYAYWKSAYDKTKGKARMKAAYNIGLYYEMKNEFTKAKEYVEEAQKLAKVGSFDERLISFYLLALNDRETNLTKLKIQMNRFDDISSK